jgi:hypothetical protein
MFPSRSSLPALTAFARPGPGASRSPTSSLLFGHRTPSSSSVPPSGLPLGALPRVDASSACPTALAVTPADRASVPVGASVAGLRSTLARFPPRKAEGLPRLLGCPLPTCRSPTSRRSSASSPYRSTEMLRSGGRSPSAPAYWSFRDCNPAARILACLHINRPITGTAARLGYRPAG